jgi:hypothetical protein
MSTLSEESNMAYQSNTILKAASLEEVISIINCGGIIEGIEGIEFTPSMLAACYAHNAITESDYDITDDGIESALDYVWEAGARFNFADALVYARKLATRD